MKWVAYVAWCVAWFFTWAIIGPVFQYGVGGSIIPGIAFMLWLAALYYGFKLINRALSKSPPERQQPK